VSKIIGSFGPLVSSIIIFMDAFITIIIGFSLPITTFGQLEIQQRESTSNKVVILTFGNAPKSQYTEAKPILDKYGFKASFFVVCNWINSDKDNSHMT
jgi:peptidoglycan/xylan/chitin deacetylase (PgdA/CDA1 family)